MIVPSFTVWTVPFSWLRALISIAVDPAYTTNHFIYLLYTVDPDTNGVDDTIEGFGRLALTFTIVGGMADDRSPMFWFQREYLEQALAAREAHLGQLRELQRHAAGSARRPLGDVSRHGPFRHHQSGR